MTAAKDIKVGGLFFTQYPHWLYMRAHHVDAIIPKGFILAVQISWHHDNPHRGRAIFLDENMQVIEASLSAGSAYYKSEESLGA